MFKWHIGNNITEHIFIQMALIGHRLLSHHIVLRAYMVLQAGQGQTLPNAEHWEEAYKELLEML